MGNYPMGCSPDDFDDTETEARIDAGLGSLSTFNTFLNQQFNGSMVDHSLMDWLIGSDTLMRDRYIEWLQDGGF